MYQITVSENNLTISFDKNLVDKPMVEKFLEYLELKSLVQKSNMTQEQAEELSQDVKQAVWANLKEKFGKS